MQQIHTHYVILIAFPLQQWLSERAEFLRCTYIACFVLFNIKRFRRYTTWCVRGFSPFNTTKQAPQLQRELIQYDPLVREICGRI